jgi:PHP family Zn ribbon phosphoesterase
VKILTQVGYADLERVGGEDLAVAVTKVRDGQVLIVAGFDGQYGVVKPA